MFKIFLDSMLQSIDVPQQTVSDINPDQSVLGISKFQSRIVMLIIKITIEQVTFNKDRPIEEYY